jgi:flagellar FliL protein
MATATPTDKPDTATEPKKSKKKLFLILGVAVLVLGLAGGGAMFYFSKKKAAEAAEAEAMEEGEAEAAAAAKPTRRDPKAKTAFVSLDTFTVNLADRDADRYAQVQLSLELNDEAATQLVKNFMPVIRNNILLVLSHKMAAELLEKDGKVKLSEEIKVEVARALGMEPPESDSQSGAAKRKRKVPPSELSPVVGVHFSNFIIQ